MLNKIVTNIPESQQTTNVFINTGIDILIGSSSSSSTKYL